MKLVKVTSSMLHGKIKQCPPHPHPKQSNKYMCMNYNWTFLTALPWQCPRLVLALSVCWPQMVWCVCVDGMNLKYAIRWHIHMIYTYIYILYNLFILYYVRVYKHMHPKTIWGPRTDRAKSGHYLFLTYVSNMFQHKGFVTEGYQPKHSVITQISVM